MDIIRLLYSLAVSLYGFSIRVASLFNSKAAQWTDGRKDLFENLKERLSGKKEVIWVHAASLGEFEQGRPVIEELRTRYPSAFILLTFFSPSGYLIRKDYDQADYVTYIPLDTLRKARRFVKTVHPRLAVFIKYEFWYNHLTELSARKIPFIFISSIFRPSQPFFHWYGGWFRKQLSHASHIFVQNASSKLLLEKAGIRQVTVSGDTRLDRVVAVAREARDNKKVELFAGDRECLLAGSTWPDDENLLYRLMESGTISALVIAPHETGADRIREISKRFGRFGVCCYTKAAPEEIATANVMIIDTIGLLSGLYRYAKICYIGGGFGKGIHNILEAVTFGKPVIFGPKYEKFREAVELKSQGGAFPVKDYPELEKITLRLMSDDDFYQRASKVCTGFVKSNAGATGRIINTIDLLLGRL
ncbi:MAG: glycosyltransferase N-terminal domain-containing protein [Bacteroidales bacterium]